MAHNIIVEPRPHRNANGSLSASKKDYVVIDRHRGKRIEVGVASSMKATEPIISEYREQVHREHLAKHPNDRAFQNKHKETASV